MSQTLKPQAKKPEQKRPVVNKVEPAQQPIRPVQKLDDIKPTLKQTQAVQDKTTIKTATFEPPKKEESEGSDQYDDDFEQTYQSASHDKSGSFGKKIPKMKPVNNSESTGVNLGGDEDEDLLLQEARQQHAKVRLNSLART